MHVRIWTSLAYSCQNIPSRSKIIKEITNYLQPGIECRSRFTRVTFSVVDISSIGLRKLPETAFILATERRILMLRVAHHGPMHICNGRVCPVYRRTDKATLLFRPASRKL